VELYRVVPGSQARRQGSRVIDSDYSNRVVTVQYVTKPAIRTGGLPLRDEDSNMVAHTVSLTVVILALSGYVVWADRRARRDRSHLAQELGQIREAIRGHEQAQEIVMAAVASQAEPSRPRWRHLASVPSQQREERHRSRVLVIAIVVIAAGVAIAVSASRPDEPRPAQALPGITSTTPAPPTTPVAPPVPGTEMLSASVQGMAPPRATDRPVRAETAPPPPTRHAGSLATTTSQPTSSVATTAPTTPPLIIPALLLRLPAVA